MDGYVRVSRVGGREGDAFIAPDVQRERIEQWATLKGIQIAEIFEDLDVSGGTLERPGLDEAMERIRSSVSAGIIVARLDRLSRAGVADALKLVEEIHQHGAQLAAIDLGVDPTTEVGELMMTLMLALGRMERRRIGANWRIAQEHAIARGVYIASKAPTGYEHDDSGQLIPGEHANHVREVFRMRAGGASWRECCDYMNAEGVIGPWGAGIWQADAAAGIIKNRAYLGESRFGDLVNTHAHDALIDAPTWRAAQSAPKASVPRSGEGALLSGFIRCAGCRYLMSPSSRSQRGEKVRIYECKKTFAMGTCPKPATILGRVVEPYVISNFGKVVGGPEFVQENSTEALDTAEREFLAAEDELRIYSTDTRIIGTLGPDMFAEGLGARRKRFDEAELRLLELRQRSRTVASYDLKDLFDQGSIADRRELIHSVIGAVMVRSVGKKAPVHQRVVLLRHADLPNDLPRRGRRVPITSFPWPDGTAAS
jgi:DNA invertase Pin-like site-specific DNA recombinase